VRDAFSSRGKAARRSLSVARLAELISRMAIRIANRSSASSSAAASSWQTAAAWPVPRSRSARRW
jgi:hypothetical protein